MKFKTGVYITVIVLLAALALPGQLAAQNPRYKLIDLGTLGGPNGFTYGGTAQALNDGGVVVGQSDTSIPDNNYPNFNPIISGPDSFLQHGFRWRNGVREELGTLPGATFGGADWVNQEGLAVGASTNGAIDPLTGWPEAQAVLWRGDGQIVDLGNSLGYESIAAALNDQGLVVGGATNKTLDSFSFLELLFGSVPNATQLRAVLWQKGVMQDLGTLGGPDAFAIAVNERGQIMGLSYTNATPNPITTIPTVDPFLWENGKMTDLGSLGGTFGGPNWLNSQGQVVGSSNLAGDSTAHPFLWDRGTLTDLGTFGGDNGQAFWINDAGDVVGRADFPGNHIHHAFLWRNGVLNDLGTVGSDPCSNALYVNSKGQVVGTSTNCRGVTLHVFLWENGGPMIDLDAFVPPGFNLSLTEPTFINERGEITINGALPNGDEHALLLVPCDDSEAGCIDATSLTPGVAQAIGASTIRRQSLNRTPAGWRARLAQGHNLLGAATPKD